MIANLIIGIAAWIAALALKGDSKRVLWGTVALVAMGTVLINAASPISFLNDSKYMLLTSDTLMREGHWHLDEHFPTFHAERQVDPASNYQLYPDQEHIHWSFPPGSVILSVPLVAAFRVMGKTVTDEHGSYAESLEVRLQRKIARTLMAVMTVLIFLTARALLPHRRAVLVALAAGLASPALSELARSLWIDTWGATLVAVVVFMVTRWVVSGKPLHPVLLSTVLSWAFFVKPTYAMVAATVFGFVLIRQRRLAIPMAITGTIWFGLYLAHNQWVFGLPFHFYAKAQSGMFMAEGMPVRFAGLLISPSRGLLIFIPWLLMIPLAWTLGEKGETSRSLRWLALVNVGIVLLVVTTWIKWWGGHSFGPRLFAGTIPWMALLLALALASMRERRWALPVAGLLIAMALFVHAQGAFNHATRAWNGEPKNVDQHPERLWDWSDPQFLR